MYFYSYAGFMIPAGLLIDGFGARVMIAAGAAVMGAGSLAMGVATAEPLLFAGRFVVGLGATVTFIGALKIGAAWFPPSQFATLAAVTATVGVLGSVAGTYPLAALVAVAGWRGAFLILGLVDPRAGRALRGSWSAITRRGRRLPMRPRRASPAWSAA